MRTRHEPTAQIPLVQCQIVENDNMKAVCELVEWSYARAEQLWLLMNKKQAHVLEWDLYVVFGQYFKNFG
jgi:hypothetical protein